MKTLRLPLLGLEVVVESNIHLESSEYPAHQYLKKQIFQKHGLRQHNYSHHSSCNHGSLSFIENKGACWLYLNHKPKFLTKLSDTANIAAKAHKETHLLHRLGRIDLLESSIEKVLGYKISLSQKNMGECQSAAIGSLYALYRHSKFSKTDIWLFKNLDRDLFEFAASHFPIEDLILEHKWSHERKIHIFG